MKKTFSKIAVAALVAGAMLTAGTANASTTKTAAKHSKHAKHRVTRLFGCGSELECDANGTASVVFRIFGVRVSDNGGVSNSALCQ